MMCANSSRSYLYYLNERQRWSGRRGTILPRHYEEGGQFLSRVASCVTTGPYLLFGGQTEKVQLQD